jgi:hypothetical protein
MHCNQYRQTRNGVLALVALVHWNTRLAPRLGGAAPRTNDRIFWEERMSTTTAPASEFIKLRPHFDPYQLDPADVLEPPTGFGNILKKIGPGIVMSAPIVGSGELIATTTLGAEVGYTVMWLIILSCLIKAVVQSFLGRYTIARGETGLRSLRYDLRGDGRRLADVRRLHAPAGQVRARRHEGAQSLARHLHCHPQRDPGRPLLHLR